jgi:hypothetical protein
MDDNIWEYPFGDLDEDDDLFFRIPEDRKFIISSQPAGDHSGGLYFDRPLLNRHLP